jgi:hypothetical protein
VTHITISGADHMPTPRRVTTTVLALCLGAATLGTTCGDLLRREPRRSQPALVEQTMGRTRITVRYNRPVARGRALFGGIVKYGEVWDPGADEATTIEVDRDVRFGGRPLAKGRYSVWAIPRPDEWTLILSSASDVPHVPYPEGRDALRIPVRVEQAPYMESLGFYFPVADSARAELALHWGTTRITVPITP